MCPHEDQPRRRPVRIHPAPAPCGLRRCGCHRRTELIETMFAPHLGPSEHHTGLQNQNPLKLSSKHRAKQNTAKHPFSEKIRKKTASASALGFVQCKTSWPCLVHLSGTRNSSSTVILRLCEKAWLIVKLSTVPNHCWTYIHHI